VEVSDTIEVHADVFICEFTLYDQKEILGYGDSSSLVITPNELDEIIGSYPEIEMLPKGSSSHSILMRMTITNRKIKTQSYSSLKSLIEQLTPYGNFTLSKTTLVVNDTGQAEIALKERLLAKAKQKALQTALMLEKEVGDVLEVRESEFKQLLEEVESLNTIYPPLSALGNMFNTSDDILNKSVYTQKLVVRYFMK